VEQWAVSHLSLLWHKKILLKAACSNIPIPLVQNTLTNDLQAQISAATRYKQCAPSMDARARLMRHFQSGERSASFSDDDPYNYYLY